jgi:glycosyltransferase involved in cell wall biosynthesis
VKIAIIATHSFPIPTPTHTGDIVILDLALALDALGHSVDLYAPAGTTAPPRGRARPILASLGRATPSSSASELGCWREYKDDLLAADVVHDFSITKRVAEEMFELDRRNVVCTPLGGNWAHPHPPLNLAVWSEAMRQRALRGATDYEGTPTPDLAGPAFPPTVKDARVVYGGVDTSIYCRQVRPKENWFLWMNRWHPAKGYRQAIDLARATGIELVMAGEHPDREMFTFQRNCALEAVEMAQGLPNVRFEWLPADPHHHEAKRELYRKACALLYTVQFQEPFGLSQVEAMACGTPVIGTAFGSVPEIVEHGITGFVCPNDNPAAWFRAVQVIGSIDPAVCREHAVRRFDRRVMAINYLHLYEDVIAGRTWGG